MKFILLLMVVPFLFISCLSAVTGLDLDDEDSSTEDTVEEAGDTEENEPEEEEEEPPEVTPVNITSDVFLSNFFDARYEYRTITVGSSYDYMVNILGEPEGSGEITDGTYYHYEHIGFNFPESHEEADTSELQVDGIVIFPEDFSKTDAVENYGWPTEDDVANFRMLYDSDENNGYYVMMPYDQEDYIQALLLHAEDFEDTSLDDD